MRRTGLPGYRLLLTPPPEVKATTHAIDETDGTRLGHSVAPMLPEHPGLAGRNSEGRHRPGPRFATGPGEAPSADEGRGSGSGRLEVG